MLYQELRNGKTLKIMKYIKFKMKFKTESPTKKNGNLFQSIWCTWKVHNNVELKTASFYLWKVINHEK